MLIDDEWNGLADLLANLIAKYASELGIDGGKRSQTAASTTF